MEKYQQELIRNLKKYRNASNFSQAKFAELCNVSTGTIGNIECGVAKPSFDLLVTMSQVLGISPAQLFTENSNIIEENDEYISQDHALLLEMYSRLKAHLKE